MHKLHIYYEALREHVATFYAGMELADTEVTDLANFMGHTRKIHREIYKSLLVAIF